MPKLYGRDCSEKLFVEDERPFLFEDVPAADRRADELYLAKYIERMGTGTGDMITFCSNAGLREPEFSLTDGFVVTIWRKKSALAGAVAENISLPTGEVSGVHVSSKHVIGKTPVKTPVKTPERILELLVANPELTLAEVAKVIDKSVRAVERASAKLVKERRLCYVGPTKGGHWEVLS
jgi:ATP-dependent DNA helicase RecG